MNQAIRSTIAIGVAVGAVLVCLAGCTLSHSYSLTPAESEIPVCEDHTPVPVESLDDTALAACDLAGTDVVFPDGTVLNVGEGTGSTQAFKVGVAAPTYSFFNVGIYGIVAAKTNPAGTHSEWWGRSEAIDRVQDAFGDVA